MAIPIFRDSLDVYSSLALLSAVLLIFALVKGNIKLPNFRGNPYPGVPLASLPNVPPLDSWTHHAAETVDRMLDSLGPEDNFQVVTNAGPMLILRNKFAEEVSRNPDLSLAEHLRKSFFPTYPGFEGVRVGLEGHIHDTLRETVAKRLTQALGLLIEHLVEETSYASKKAFGESEEWASIELGPNALDLVCRITSRALLGKRLSRNDRWLNVSKSYAACSGQACASLFALPGLIRPIGHWFLPACRKLRGLVKDATDLIDEEVQLRKTSGSDAKDGACDAMSWLSEESKSRGRQLDTPDLVALQLGLAVAANHTTTGAVFQALRHLCEHPDVIPALREELIKTIGESGWTKTSFYQLRLMDSFLLESQRHSRGPAQLVRLATRDVPLSSGFVIKKGTRVQVMLRNSDPAVYPEPNSFDAFRFYGEKATSGPSNSRQLVTVSSEQMGFGLGQHACPGRFFVANEMKMMLAHLIMKYDWSLDPVYGKFKDVRMEGHPMPDFAAKIRCKRRKEEIDVDLVAM